MRSRRANAYTVVAMTLFVSDITLILHAVKRLLPITNSSFSERETLRETARQPTQAVLSYPDRACLGAFPPHTRLSLGEIEIWRSATILDLIPVDCFRDRCVFYLLRTSTRRVRARRVIFMAIWPPSVAHSTAKCNPNDVCLGFDIHRVSCVSELVDYEYVQCTCTS